MAIASTSIAKPSTARNLSGMPVEAGPGSGAIGQAPCRTSLGSCSGSTTTVAARRSPRISTHRRIPGAAAPDGGIVRAQRNVSSPSTPRPKTLSTLASSPQTTDVERAPNCVVRRLEKRERRGLI